jgi:uncharacterized membrane protein YgaE (UPF0421/DUF939 family)
MNGQGRKLASVMPMSGIQLAFRASVAAGIAYTFANLLDLQFPIFAAVAAVIATDLVPSETLRLGQRRLLGTVVGAVCGTAVRLIVQPGAWTLGLGILVAMLVANLLRLTEGARVAGYVSGLIVVTEGVDPWLFALIRSVETALGVCVAWFISLIPKLIRTEDAPNSEA